MLPFYSVQTILNTQLSHETLLTIFKQTEHLGLSLLSNNPYLYDTIYAIPVEEAAILLIDQIQKEKKEIINNTYLATQYMFLEYSSKNCVALYITEYTLPQTNMNVLDISISPEDINAWYKKPDFLDFDRYIRLLLAMCKDFTPLWLSTGDEGFNEEFYVVRKDLECRPRKNFDLTASPQFKVDVTILSGNNPEALYSLLEHGVKKGWTYYAPNCNAIEPATCLSIEQAVNYILSQPLNHTTSATLVCLINEMSYELSFRLRFNQYRMLTLKPNFLPVNLRDSVLHLLDLCSDFCIAELTTFDARFNEYVLIQYNYESMK